MSILIDKSHPRPRPGHHRARGPVPHPGDARLRHAGRRRRDAGPRRPGSPRRPGLRHRPGRRSEDGANASCIFVPARLGATDAILEATVAGLPLVVCITDGMPINDMVKTVDYVRSTATRLIGGNCPGLLTAGDCKIGIIPGDIVTPGPVGILSRSGTLTYEIVDSLSREGTRIKVTARFKQRYRTT